MPLTERDRHDAYEALQQAFGDRTDTVIELLRPDHDELVTKDDLALGLADVRLEIAELRTEMADLRTELKTEMRDLTSGQTRTMMLGLVGSITALSVTQLVIAALG